MCSDKEPIAPLANRFDDPGLARIVSEESTELRDRPRDHLVLDEVWQGADDGDDENTRAISELRRHYGDDPRQPRVIETIRKRGYRLLVRAHFD
ncbi:MAG: helix-turn-helix domain-containing protein, partial [Acidobacteriota bacterium]